MDQEVTRLMEIFKDADENKIALLEGQIIENARLRVQIEQLNKVAEASGLIKVHPKNPTMQKETTVAKMLIKVRANYINSTKLLCKELGVNEDDFEDDLGGFE